MMIQLLLADGLIELVAKGIPAILFVLWLIGQAVNEKQKQAKAAPRQQPRPVAAPPAAPGRAQRAPSEIEEEIDAFLRRAAEKKGQAPPPREETVILVPPKDQAARPKAAAPLASPAAKREKGDARQRPLARPLNEPAAGGAQPARPRPVTPHPAAASQTARPAELSYRESILGPLSAPLSQRQSHLGAEVAQADDKMEAHLRQAFGRQLGRLQHREVESAQRTTESPVARSIAEMLKSPQGVQQMIVINEILRRPEV